MSYNVQHYGRWRGDYNCGKKRPLDNFALTKGDVLTVWIAMLPTDVLSGKSLGFTLHGTDGTYSEEFSNVSYVLSVK